MERVGKYSVSFFAPKFLAIRRLKFGEYHMTYSLQTINNKKHKNAFRYLHLMQDLGKSKKIDISDCVFVHLFLTLVTKGG